MTRGSVGKKKNISILKFCDSSEFLHIASAFGVEPPYQQTDRHTHK